MKPHGSQFPRPSGLKSKVIPTAGRNGVFFRERRATDTVLPDLYSRLIQFFYRTPTDFLFNHMNGRKFSSRREGLNNSLLSRRGYAH